MMRVRYPTGLVVQYNTANLLKYQTGVWELYTKDPEKGGAWIASLSPESGALVEVVTPCAVERPTDCSPARALEIVRAHLHDVRGASLARLKIELRGFNAKTLRWRNR